tara:strand:+ start:458 stop:1690 length:1233 start_codon:yes stop_codon:yes gene_type:complete
MDILKVSLDILTDELRRDIKSKGGKIYQIGGAVRDEFLGKVSKDLDLIIAGIDINDLQKILNQHGKVNLVGKSFGVLKFNPFGQEGEPVDIVVPRIEVSTGEGHKDFEVRLGKDITLEEEQLRRDFWMNAIAKDIETGEIIDIGGKGQLDIKNKQISVINPKAFEDDPLRMLRAVQFASRFNFKIENETMKEIKKNAAKIKTVSNDRYQEEFRKMFEKSSKPTVGVKLLIETGLMNHIFSKGKVNPLMDKLSKDTFPTFLALFGEGSSGSEIQSVMKLSNKDANIVQAVMDFQKINLDDLNVVKFLSKVKDKKDVIRNIDALQKAKGQTTLSEQLKSMKGKPTSLKELAVTGKDLLDEGISGRKIGEILNYLLELAVKTGKNDKEFLLSRAKSEFNEELWKSILRRNTRW